MIIDINFWFLAVVTCLLGAMSPGPSLVVVSHNTMSLGFRYGVITSISHGVGVGIYALLTVFGITLIIQSSDIILPLIRIFGCIFLLYLAWNMYHFSWDTDGEKEYKTRSRSTFSVVKDGFLIAAINPKIILFFSAFFAQFIDVHSQVSMKLSLALIATLVDISWYVFVSYLISQSQYTKIFKGREEYVSKGFSCVLIGSSLYFLVALLT